MSQNSKGLTPFYAWHKDILPIIKNAEHKFRDGNFSLWFNKFVPLSNITFKASNEKGSDSNKIEYYYYLKMFNKILSQNSKRLLLNKHIYQMGFCKSMERVGMECLIIKAKLKKRLITGLGQTHPSETGMLFDHNIGVPYIPSSSIKGVVRFAHILNEILDEDLNLKEEFKNKDYLKDKEINNLIDIFGGNKEKTDNSSEAYKGSVIFLDAYPVNIPKLDIDIMNPHYGKYYSEEEPPADYLEPNPIKFLTVKANEEFIFRVVVKKELFESTKKALERAIQQEGVGAKTSLGYGLFKIEGYEEPEELKKEYQAFIKRNLSEEEKLRLEETKFIEKIQKTDKNSIDALFNEWQNNNLLKNSKNIALIFKNFIRKKKSNGELTKNYRTLLNILGIQEEEISKKKNEKNEIKSKNVQEAVEQVEQLKKKINNLISKIETKKISKKEAKKELKKISKKVDSCSDNEVKELYIKLKQKIKKDS